jgi:hypothetical protein
MENQMWALWLALTFQALRRTWQAQGVMALRSIPVIAPYRDSALILASLDFHGTKLA